MFTYEDKAEDIDKEISKRRGKWQLTILRWMDYEDVAQILRMHIAKKWSYWDQSRSLGPWAQTIISRQIQNLLRNYYTNYARPCVSCPESLGEEGCRFTPSGEQCSECPAYKKWANSKKNGYDIKMPLELENHSQEVNNKIDDNINYKETIRRVLNELEKKLSPDKFKAFKMLYIDNVSDEFAISALNLKVNENSKYSGKKALSIYKDSLQKEVREIIKDSDIGEFWS